MGDWWRRVAPGVAPRVKDEPPTRKGSLGMGMASFLNPSVQQDRQTDRLGEWVWQ